MHQPSMFQEVNSLSMHQTLSNNLRFLIKVYPKPKIM